MTSIEIQLPPRLAREAAKAGLFAPERIEAMFRRQLHADDLRSFLREERILENMVMQEIQAEVDAVRAEKRGAARA